MVRHVNELIAEILGVMNAMAKKQGYTLVLDRTALTTTGYPPVLYTSGENDLTEVPDQGTQLHRAADAGPRNQKPRRLLARHQTSAREACVPMKIRMRRVGQCPDSL